MAKDIFQLAAWVILGCFITWGIFLAWAGFRSSESYKTSRPMTRVVRASSYYAFIIGILWIMLWVSAVVVNVIQIFSVDEWHRVTS